MRTALRTASLPLLLAAASCIELSTPDPGGDELPGIIHLEAEEPRVTVSQTVRAGQFVSVEVTTFGDQCTQLGRTAVNVVGNTADVRPFDRFQTGAGCTGEVRLLRHSASVRFDDVGTATVRIHGRRMPGEVAITVERTVTITPP